MQDHQKVTRCCPSTCSSEPCACVSYVHNLLQPNSSLRFDTSVNNSMARISTSYTSLVATGPQSGYVVYSKLLPSPSVAFALRFALR